MNKFQAMARSMMLFNSDGSLDPRSREYRVLRRLIAFKIDRIGPDAAFEQIAKHKEEILKQVRMMTI